MSRDAELLAQALERWKEERAPQDAIALDTACRDASVARIAAAIATSRGDERWRRRALLGAVAVAAAIVLAVVGLRALEPKPRQMQRGIAQLTLPEIAVPIVRSSRGAALSRGKRLQAGDRITTEAGGSAELELASGVRVTVAESSRLSLGTLRPGVAESISLDRGGVSVQAPPLGQATFSVATPNGRVMVRGTRFEVRVGDAGTEVEVSEGRVVVQREGREVTLGAGERWSSQPAASPSGARPRAPAPASPSAASSLAEQNRLLAAATQALHQGKRERARALLDELLRRFPDSPLAEEARAQRARAGSDGP